MTGGNREQPIDDGLVFVLGANAQHDTCVHALSVDTGETVWETAVPGVKHEPKWTMVVEEDGIALATGSGHVFFMTRETGAARWQQTVERREKKNTYRPLVLIANRNVIVALQGVTSCFDLEGRLLWKRATGTAALGVIGKVVEPR